MACCALAVIIMLQLLAPIRWWRERIGINPDPVNPETNWQLTAQPISRDQVPAKPRGVSHRSGIFLAMLGAELLILVAVYFSMALTPSPEIELAGEFSPNPNDYMCRAGNRLKTSVQQVFARREDSVDLVSLTTEPQASYVDN